MIYENCVSSGVADDCSKRESDDKMSEISVNTSENFGLSENERIDEVNDGLKLIQKTDGLVFGSDALLLAGYMKRNSSATAAELGGGTGIISLLAAERNKFRHITVFEVQEEFADLCKRNAELNALGDRLSVCCADIRQCCGKNFITKPFDAVFTNPPYMKVGSGKGNVNDKKNIARREVCGNIGDFCAAAAGMLKYGGIFYVVYIPDRLPDLFSAMRESSIEPKRLTLVCPDLGKSPCLILCEGRKNGGCGMTVTENLYIQINGKWSDDYLYIMNTGDFNDRFKKP